MSGQGGDVPGPGGLPVLQEGQGRYQADTGQHIKILHIGWVAGFNVGTEVGTWSKTLGEDNYKVGVLTILHLFSREASKELRGCWSKRIVSELEVGRKG